MVKDTVRYAGLVSLESCDFPWWLSFLPWRKLPPLPPHGLQVALRMEVVSFALRHQYEPSWSRCLSFSHSSPLIYLSVSVSLSVSVCLFTNQSCDLSLNISNNSLSLVSVFGSLPLSLLHLLSLYFFCSLPTPTPTLSMVQWCPLWSNCGIYMQYRIVIFHSSEGCATFSISGSGVWDNACYRLLVNKLLSQNYIKIEVTSHFSKL